MSRDKSQWKSSSWNRRRTSALILTQAGETALANLARGQSGFFRGGWNESSSRDDEVMTVCRSWCYIAVSKDLVPYGGGFSRQWLRMRDCIALAYLFFVFCRTRR